MNSMNLAARAGRWSANNWKKAFFGWLIVAVAALFLGMTVGHKQIADWGTASGEAAKAQRILEQAGFKAPATESVLIQSKDATVNDPKLRSGVVGVAAALSGRSDVTHLLK